MVNVRGRNKMLIIERNNIFCEKLLRGGDV